MSTTARRAEDAALHPHGSAVLAFAVFPIFTIAGPPLGGLALLAGGMLFASPGSLGAVRVPTLRELDFMLRGFGLISMFSYLFGGAQASCVGLVAAIAQYLDRQRRIPLIPVLAASLFTGIAFIGIVALKSSQPMTGTMIAGFLALHCAAGIGGWLVASLLLWPFRRRRAPVTA
jgi:hypothetical protein